MQTFGLLTLNPNILEQEGHEPRVEPRQPEIYSMADKLVSNG